jgi:hypothetical protein
MTSHSHNSSRRDDEWTRGDHSQDDDERHSEEIVKLRFEEPSSLSNDVDPANGSKSFGAESLNRVNDSEGKPTDTAGRDKSSRSEQTDLSGTSRNMGSFPALLSL